jgi:hypothetical protein
MILCFSQDDYEIVSKAYEQQTKIFGVAYCYLKNHSFSRFLGAHENLFITGHGSEREVGDKEGEFAFTPDQLAKVLKDDVLPGEYEGSIYVSACDTSPTYVQGLLAGMGSAYAGRIYGCKGDIELAIEPPANNMWIAAT